MHNATRPPISSTGFIISLLILFSPSFIHAAYFKRINADGFGNSHNTGGLEVKTMAVFQDKLYAGVTNKTEGAQIWRFDGAKWQQANKSGFGSRDNTAIAAMIATRTALYASTASRECGEVWQFNGKDWACIHSGAFGNTKVKTVNSMAFFKNKLYVGLWDQVTSKPAEVWAYDGTAHWQQVNTPGFGSAHNLNVTGLFVSKVSGTERLYAIVWKSFKYAGPDAGCDVWAYDGKIWTKVNAGREGFGEPGKGRAGIEPFSIAEFQGKLYVGLWSFGAGRGWEVWSYDGRDWRLANAAIAGSETPLRLCIALTAHKDRLYAAVTDAAKDFELWSFDGRAWMNIIGKQSPLPKKLGSPDNIVINAMASCNNHLYLGVANNRTGYQVWESSADQPPGNVSAARPAAVVAYTVPEITAVSTLGRVYHIPVLFDLKDPDGDTCSVVVEYQAQGGKWRPASIETVSGEAVISPAVNNPSQPNLISSLETHRPVNHCVCVWLSEKDIGESTGTFTIRLTPSDSRAKGMAVVSKPFLVDNRKPPADEMVYVPAGKFYIDKFEYPNHVGYYPELSKTWYEARNTCQALGKDLCTIAQWELAYYGNKKRRYPYGNDFGSRDRDFCNTQGAADEVPVPSGMYQNCVNDLGIYDMGGNVYEWTGLDEKQVYMADQSYRSDSMQQSMFNVDEPSHRHSYLGFRCCKPE